MCRKKGDEDRLLLCDDCNQAFHQYCLRPAVLEVPVGDWFCPGCRVSGLKFFCSYQIKKMIYKTKFSPHRMSFKNYIAFCEVLCCYAKNYVSVNFQPLTQRRCRREATNYKKLDQGSPVDSSEVIEL